MKKLFFVGSQILGLFAVSVPYAFGDAININPSPPKQVVPPSSSLTLNSLIQFIISALVAIGVVTSLGFLIYGGIKWVLSGGDKSAVEAARNHVVAAIIGLVIIALSFVILTFVGQIIGIVKPEQTIFNLCIPSLSGGGCQ